MNQNPFGLPEGDESARFANVNVLLQQNPTPELPVPSLGITTNPSDVEAFKLPEGTVDQIIAQDKLDHEAQLKAAAKESARIAIEAYNFNQSMTDDYELLVLFEREKEKEKKEKKFVTV